MSPFSIRPVRPEKIVPSNRLGAVSSINRSSGLGGDRVCLATHSQSGRTQWGTLAAVGTTIAIPAVGFALLGDAGAIATSATAASFWAAHKIARPIDAWLNQRGWTFPNFNKWLWGMGSKSPASFQAEPVAPQRRLFWGWLFYGRDSALHVNGHADAAVRPVQSDGPEIVKTPVKVEPEPPVVVAPPVSDVERLMDIEASGVNALWDFLKLPDRRDEQREVLGTIADRILNRDQGSLHRERWRRTANNMSGSGVERAQLVAIMTGEDTSLSLAQKKVLIENLTPVVRDRLGITVEDPAAKAEPIAPPATLKEVLLSADLSAEQKVQAVMKLPAGRYGELADIVEDPAVSTETLHIIGELFDLMGIDPREATKRVVILRRWADARKVDTIATLVLAMVDETHRSDEKAVGDAVHGRLESWFSASQGSRNIRRRVAARTMELWAVQRTAKEAPPTNAAPETSDDPFTNDTLMNWL